MKVLLISHTCQSLTEGQPKAHFLGATEGIELCVLTPNRWMHYGSWRAPQMPPAPTYLYKVGKVFWPWLGPAQYYLHWYPDLPKLLREFRPDIIDIWEEPWSLLSAQVCWWRGKMLPGTKIITETEQNIRKRLPWPFETFRSYTLARADFAVGRSEEALQHLKDLGYEGKSSVVSNAVDGELFRVFSENEREDYRIKLGVQDFVAGYVGRLVEEKGIADMVDALAMLPADISLVFVGSGPFDSALQRRALERGVWERCRFLGAKPMSELPAIMNALNVLVLPSHTTPSWKEQFGRVLIEAGACGIPVIGSSSGAIPDVVGNAGLVFPERNPTALTVAIKRLRDNAEEAALMGREGRSRVDLEFTWQRVAENMAHIYRDLLGPVV